MNLEEIKTGKRYRCSDGKIRTVRAIIGTPKLDSPFWVCFQKGFNAPECVSITYFASWAEAEYVPHDVFFDYELSQPCTSRLTEVFTIRKDEWELLLDGTLVKATFNSKGAAEAAIPVERARRLKKAEKEHHEST